MMKDTRYFFYYTSMNVELNEILTNLCWEKTKSQISTSRRVFAYFSRRETRKQREEFQTAYLQPERESTYVKFKTDPPL